MNLEEFNEAIRALLGKYNAYVSENSDLWCCTDALLFYKNEDDDKAMFAVSGFGYDRSGEIVCHFDSFIAVTTKCFKEEYGF